MKRASPTERMKGERGAERARRKSEVGEDKAINVLIIEKGTI